MFNKYQIEARIFPTIISAIPFIIYQYFFLNKKLSDFLIYLGKTEILGQITISIIFLYFISNINRFISKTFFERDEIYMPTTSFLLLNNKEYSIEYKKKIYKKLEKDFELNIPSKELQEKDELNSRKIISEIMSLARKSIGSGKLLLQHNIEYGFWRNLVGGSILAILFSLINIYFSTKNNNEIILKFSFVLLIIFLIIFIFNQFFINKAGKMYTRVLIQEYMEKK